MKKILGLILGALMFCTSCMTPKKVLYLQDMDDSSAVALNAKFEARIAPSDRLGIFVTSATDNKEMTEMFNQARSNNSNMGGRQGGWYGYLVDVNGNIYFPVLGKLHVEGLTRIELQDTITHLLKKGGYLGAPLVNVELSNFRINFLGADGGRVIYVDGDQCTLFEALAMAGDLKDFTRRDKVKVYRQVDGKMTCRTLDLRSSKVFNDPYFQLQQNDYVVTQSIRSQYYRKELSYWMSWITGFTSIASFGLSIYTVVKLGGIVY